MAHAPHPLQSSGTILAIPSAISSIAPAGQLSLQTPHDLRSEWSILNISKLLP
ncbi:MAG: hypothetical protein SOT14_11375 [Succinivibrio sp.]|nr:hypothetical protein [Succinivibrio sp.]